MSRARGDKVVKMKLSADRDALLQWVEEAQLANTTYFRVRRDLFARLTSLLKRESDVDVTVRVTISHDVFVSLRGFLLSRNEQENDNKVLSFEKSLLEISRACE